MALQLICSRLVSVRKSHAAITPRSLPDTSERQRSVRGCTRTRRDKRKPNEMTPRNSLSLPTLHSPATYPFLLLPLCCPISAMLSFRQLLTQPCPQHLLQKNSLVKVKATCTAGRPSGSSERLCLVSPMLACLVLLWAPHMHLLILTITIPAPVTQLQPHRLTSDACGLPRRATPACLDLLHPSRCCSSVPLYPCTDALCLPCRTTLSMVS